MNKNKIHLPGVLAAYGVEPASSLNGVLSISPHVIIGDSSPADRPSRVWLWKCKVRFSTGFGQLAWDVAWLVSKVSNTNISKSEKDREQGLLHIEKCFNRIL